MPSDIIMLRYSFPQIVLQEVPDEISLALSISGCPLKCRGCHSAFTWDQTFGDDLTDKVLHDLIKKHKHISCVLLYDGLHNVDRLIELFNIVKSYELKTAQVYRDWETDRKSTRLNSSHITRSRMPSSA